MEPSPPPPARGGPWCRPSLLAAAAWHAGARGAAGPALPAGASADANSLVTEALFLRLGFSFIVGLAAGYALKLAFKVALVLIGIILIGVFALQYAGLAEVDWSSVGVRYDTGADWLGAQGGALLDFMGQNLPSAASFLAGLALGLKL